MNKKHVPKPAGPTANRLDSAPMTESEKPSLLSTCVDTAKNHVYRLRATLNQVNRLEAFLIGSPVSDTCVGDSKAAETPLLYSLRDVQEEESMLLTEIGEILDRLENAVRK